MAEPITLAVIFGGAVAASCGGLCYYWEKATLDNVTFTVKDKSVDVSGGGDSSVQSSYLIHTDGETFTNETVFLHKKIPSDDLQGQIEIGKTYNALVCGKRIPMMGLRRNIIKLEEVTNTPPKNKIA